jgi:hypothetical protein
VLAKLNQLFIERLGELVSVAIYLVILVSGFTLIGMSTVISPILLIPGGALFFLGFRMVKQL